MSNLSIFNFNKSEVRIQLVNNEPLFCLTDVTSILKVKNAHASRFNFNLGGVHKMYTPTYNQYGTEVKQELTFINEPNLYRVIFRSNKKEAIDFQNWVFDEVLPTIRKTGSYSLTINTEQKYSIRKAVNERAYRTGEHHQTIYHKLYDQFKINSYESLPASKFDDAIKFLGGVKQRDFKAVNLDNMERQQKYLITIQKYNASLLDDYNEHLAQFISKNIPHLHYNISTALSMVRRNVEFSLNHIRSELPRELIA